ncbi:MULTISPECIES: ATP-binding protein [unclassified Agarivorans]|uniref:ATP-binding protein n=1 Tax=unclassified Agarivorans TaxID=2636026 RepID=UPI003D7DF6FB
MTEKYRLLVLSKQDWSAVFAAPTRPWLFSQLDTISDPKALQTLFNDQRLRLVVIDLALLTEQTSHIAQLEVLITQHKSTFQILLYANQLPDAKQLCQWVNSFQPRGILGPEVNSTTLLQAIEQHWPVAALITPQQQWLAKQLAAKVAQFRATFFDYTELSDEQLSDKVISALYTFFQDNDEDHLCRTYSANHILTQEGKANQFLWFIAKGEVVLNKQQEGKVLEVARMRAGSLVGGMSFVTGEPGFTSGITSMQTDVIKLDRPTFAKVLDSSNQLLPLFTNLLLRHFNRRLQKSIQTKLTLQNTLDSLDSAHEQLIEKEKMAVLGQLISGVAHELNNPVAAIIRGSDTIATQLPQILEGNLSHSQTMLGQRLLKMALTLTPMSTSDIRQRSKNCIKLFGDAINARKAVSIGLDHPETRQQYLECRANCSHNELIGALERYHQIGNFLRNIQVCASRISGLVKGLKHYAGQDPEQPVLADLNEGLAETLVILENRLRHFEVECNYGLLPIYRCYPIALQQVWTNLIANALDAMGTNGKLLITSQYIEGSPPLIKVTVEDNGDGVQQELIDRIFELNFTTKREGNFGLGIGLTVCQQIVGQHDGRIEVESEPGQFTRFIVSLPLKPN